MFIKPNSPFYKNPALWLVIGLPLTTVIVGTIFLIYSIKYDDGAVIDDYYKKGKQINMTIERDEAAVANRLFAVIELDQSRKLINLVLEAKDGFVYPEELSLTFIHRTLAARDIELRLIKQQASQYLAVLPQVPASRWHVELAAESWRLKGQIEYPQESTVELGINSNLEQPQG